MKKYLFIFISILFLGCSDNSQTYIHDKTILDAKIECLSLTVFPPQSDIQNTLNSLYNFKQDCAYNLIVSYKTNIICNSNQNSDKKARGLPSGYIRMEIKKDSSLKYTYYKDLKEALSGEDAKDGFEKIMDDLII